MLSGEGGAFLSAANGQLDGTARQMEMNHRDPTRRTQGLPWVGVLTPMRLFPQHLSPYVILRDK